MNNVKRGSEPSDRAEMPVTILRNTIKIVKVVEMYTIASAD